MGRLQVLLLALCLCVASTRGESIRLVDAFPFGPGEGDEAVPTGNDATATVMLDTPILFYGELRQSITVRFVSKGPRILLANCSSGSEIPLLNL